MSTESAGEGRVLIGTAGWSYPDWEGIVYPPGMPKSTHPLGFLSRWFDAVEVNSSFYRQPDARNAAAWIRHVSDNPRFRFSVKLWQGFTHEKNAWPGDGEVRRYVAGVLPLLDAGRLGAVLVQFPWSFRRTVESRRHLARIAEAFEGLPLTVEVRHTSWDVPEFYDSLKKLGMAFCAIDQPLLHDCLPPSDRVTAPLGYARLHGRNAEQWFREGAGRDQRYNYLYNTDDLDVWIERVRGMRKKVNELFMITNNHYRGQAVVNALEMQSALGQLRETPPPWLVEQYPRLKNCRIADKG
jgi:uncharacterized protein YecE (DUF72 family)